MKTISLFFKIAASFAAMVLIVSTPISAAFAGSSVVDADAEALSKAKSESVAVGGNQGQGQGQAIDQRFEGTKIPKPAARAPSIGAPALTASMVNTCLGSKSKGFTAGVVGFAAGVTSGKTVQDAPCNARLDVATWITLNEFGIAFARMCQLPENRAAAKAAGKPCPQDVATLIEEKDDAISWLKDNRHTAKLQTALLTTPATN